MSIFAEMENLACTQIWGLAVSQVLVSCVQGLPQYFVLVEQFLFEKTFNIKRNCCK